MRVGRPGRPGGRAPAAGEVRAAPARPAHTGPRAVLRLQADAGNRATSSVLRLPLQRSVAVQRLGLDDLTWQEVTSVTHLGKFAYEVSTAKQESLVVKKSSKAGKLQYDPGDEGAVQEALAAGVGQLEGLGVTTARTRLIETAGKEGQLLLEHLRTVKDGGDLADLLAGTEVFLVMQRAPGVAAENAAQLIAGSSPAERIRFFAGLGRLWAFDVLINNTDRFTMSNWGNVILGPGGSVVGIDQMIGLTASDKGAGFADEEAGKHLKKVLDPSTRRSFALDIFESLTKRLGAGFAALRALFVPHFERGALEGLDAISALDPEQVRKTQTEVPPFAERVAAEIGLGGAAVVVGLLAGARKEIGANLTAVRREIEVRGEVTAALDPARQARASILTEIGAAAGKLQEEWPDINKWFTGKDAYWKERVGGLGHLRDLDRDRFLAAVKLDLPDEIRYGARAQTHEWREGLDLVWAAVAALLAPLKHPHAEIKPLIATLNEVVRQQREYVPIVDRM